MRDNITGQVFQGIGPISCAPVAAPTVHLLRVKFENSERLKGSAAARGNCQRFVKRPVSMLYSCRSRNLSAVLKTKIMSRRPTKVLCRCKNLAKAIRINVAIRISLRRVGFNLATIFSSPPSPQINTRADLQMPFLCPLSVPCTWTHVCPSDIIWPQFVTAGSVESRIVLHLPCVLCFYETHPIWRTNVHVVLKKLALIVDFFKWLQWYLVVPWCRKVCGGWSNRM
jgi:hypothetical protein